MRVQHLREFVELGLALGDLSGVRLALAGEFLDQPLER